MSALLGGKRTRYAEFLPVVTAEHEQADRRLQVALPAIVVHLAERHVALTGDLFHAVPECLFEAHAGLVAAHGNLANNRRLHRRPQYFAQM